MTESKFKEVVQDFLNSINAYHVKYFGCQYTTAGVPDILVCYKGKFIGLELKTDSGKTTVLQKHHLYKIQQAGGVGIVLRPKTFQKFKREVISGAVFSQQSEYI